MDPTTAPPEIETGKQTPLKLCRHISASFFSYGSYRFLMASRRFFALVRTGVGIGTFCRIYRQILPPIPRSGPI